MSTPEVISVAPATKVPVVPISDISQKLATLIKQYGCGGLQFSGTENGLYERHLVFDNIAARECNARMHFEAFGRAVRDTDHFSPDEHGVFEPLRKMLFADGDYYMHLADLKSYIEAGSRKPCTVLQRNGPGEQISTWPVPESSPATALSPNMQLRYGEFMPALFIAC